MNHEFNILNTQNWFLVALNFIFLLRVMTRPLRLLLLIGQWQYVHLLTKQNAMICIEMFNRRATFIELRSF